jgi:hypothetical protein
MIPYWRFPHGVFSANGILHLRRELMINSEFLTAKSRQQREAYRYKETVEDLGERLD